MVFELSNIERLASLFRALSDPVRLAIFEWLRCCEHAVDLEAGVTVGQVCCQVTVAPSTVSHHLKELRQAGLIRTRKEGRTVICSVEPAALEILRRFAGSPCCSPKPQPKEEPPP